jgi:hypothetical protein
MQARRCEMSQRQNCEMMRREEVCNGNLHQSTKRKVATNWFDGLSKNLLVFALYVSSLPKSSSWRK